MEIKRDQYLNKLLAKRSNGLIKVITGLRRSGKSYLLFKIFKDHLLSEGVDPAHIIEVAFDSYEYEAYRDPAQLWQYVKERITDDGQYYVLFDEVQLLVDFEAVLNGLIRMANVDVYVTGSNAKFLSRDVITEFRGRGDELHMAPLSFAEFMSVYDGNKYDGWNEYILYGGLPPVVLLPDAEQKIELLKRLFEETYLNDIIGRYHLRNRDELDELLNMLSSSVGSLTNPNKLANTFKSVKQSPISPKTIKKYLEYLTDSYLIEAAVRYDVRGRKYINTPLKYYFTDLGLRNARINFRQIEQTHLMENVIYNELRIRGYNVDVGLVEVINREADGRKQRKRLEIDFICNMGAKRYYLQSAFAMPDAAKLAQEARPLLRVDDSFKKIIITRDAPASWYTEEGILIMNVFDFLLDADSLEL